MAADSQATVGQFKFLNVVKIFKEENYIMAFCGAIDEGQLFKSVLDEELKAKDCRISKGFGALVWWNDGSFEEYYDSLVGIPFQGKFTAMGSGLEIAMAAMECGKSASEAVAIAKKYDITTGGKIIAFSWDKLKGKKKKNGKLPGNHIQEPVCEVSTGGEQEGRVGGDSQEVHGLSPKTNRKIWLRTD